MVEINKKKYILKNILYTWSRTADCNLQIYGEMLQ